MFLMRAESVMVLLLGKGSLKSQRRGIQDLPVEFAKRQKKASMDKLRKKPTSLSNKTVLCMPFFPLTCQTRGIWQR